MATISEAQSKPNRQTRRLNLQQRRIVLAYVFLAPTLIGLIIFLFIPLVWGIGLSFTDYTPGVPSQFIGLENYETLWSDRVVNAAVGVVVRYTLAVVPWVVVIPLLLAFPLNRSFRGIGFFRSGVYFPHIISMVVVATVFIYIYRSDGIINEVMVRIYGLFGREWEAIPFLKKSDWALWGVIFVTFFKSTGYYTILYLAGLQNVPQELVDAAMIDGAGWWQRLWHVILPMIRPMATLIFIVALIGSIKLFGEVFVMTGGGPGLSTQSLMLTVYQQAFQRFQFGYASALAIVTASVILVLSIISLKFSERD